jgi:hypothetical protein
MYLFIDNNAINNALLEIMKEKIEMFFGSNWISTTTFI